MSALDELRAEVALGCRILGFEDHGDFVWGHVSARDPDGRGVWMKASTYGFDEIGREQVILVSWEGEVLEGEAKRHSEFPIHTELMRAREDVGAVVHTHAPWSVAFASTEQPLRPISHDGTLFVPPDMARFTLTGDLPTAVMTAVFLERACRANMRALAAGGPRTWSSDTEALAKREHVYSPQLAWDYLARRLRA